MHIKGFIQVHPSGRFGLFNNIFVGPADRLFSNDVFNFSATTARNMVSDNAVFLHFKDPVRFDYHLNELCATCDSAYDPTEVIGAALFPEFEFVYPHDSTMRPDTPRNIGAFGLSSAARVRWGRSIPAFQNYPNPVSRHTIIPCPIVDGEVAFDIANVTGIVVSRSVEHVRDSQIDVACDLSPGVYYYTITRTATVSHGQFVVAP